MVASHRRSLTARERPKLTVKPGAQWNKDERTPREYDNVDDAAAPNRDGPAEDDGDDDAGGAARAKTRRYNPPATGSKESYTLLKVRAQAWTLFLLWPAPLQSLHRLTPLAAGHTELRFFLPARSLVPCAVLQPRRRSRRRVPQGFLRVRCRLPLPGQPVGARDNQHAAGQGARGCAQEIAS